jgi:hypothetical protein
MIVIVFLSDTSLKTLENFLVRTAGTPPGRKAAVANRETGSNRPPLSPKLAA